MIYFLNLGNVREKLHASSNQNITYVTHYEFNVENVRQTKLVVSTNKG